LILKRNNRYKRLVSDIAGQERRESETGGEKDPREARELGNQVEGNSNRDVGHEELMRRKRRVGGE
jgi:hypothetical protein